VGTSSTEAPTAQALVARSGSKASDDNLANNNPDLLNFDEAKSEIVCRMSSRLQRCWLDSGKPDCAVWYFGWSDFHAPDASSAFLVLGHEDVEGGLWASLRLAPLIFFCHWPSFGLFGLIILDGHSSPMTTSLPLADSA
jgi:hypothetical protein